MKISQEELEVLLPTGRLIITKMFPEYKASLHVHSHVGVEKDGSRNIDKSTILYTNDKRAIVLTLAIKQGTLFFIQPEYDSK